MSDTNRTQITGRVDVSLRDRIAAVIADYLRGELNWGDDLAPYLADAVIEAIQADLAPILAEYETARQYDADCGEADNSGNDAGDKLARYVTEWENDEDQ